MRLIDLIWITALLLALTSLAAVAYVVLARVVRSVYQARKARLRTRLSAELLISLQGGGEVDFSAIRGTRRNQLAEILVDLLNKLRGGERERLLEIARRAHLPEHFTRQILRGRGAARASAVEALSEMPLEGTPDLLRKALEDRDIEVRLAAAQGLVLLGTPTPMREVIGALAEPVFGVSERALALLSRSTTESRSELASIAQDRSLPVAVRVLSVRALGTAGDLSLVGMLSGLAEDGPEELRVAAFGALGTLGHPAAQPAIAAGLHDDSAEVRAAAAEAAGHIGLPHLVSVLEGLLSDDAWWVRVCAGEALMELTPGRPA